VPFRCRSVIFRSPVFPANGRRPRAPFLAGEGVTRRSFHDRLSKEERPYPRSLHTAIFTEKIAPVVLTSRIASEERSARRCRWDAAGFFFRLGVGVMADFLVLVRNQCGHPGSDNPQSPRWFGSTTAGTKVVPSWRKKKPPIVRDRRRYRTPRTDSNLESWGLNVNSRELSSILAIVSIALFIRLDPLTRRLQIVVDGNHVIHTRRSENKVHHLLGIQQDHVPPAES